MVSRTIWCQAADLPNAVIRPQIAALHATGQPTLGEVDEALRLMPDQVVRGHGRARTVHRDVVENLIAVRQSESGPRELHWPFSTIRRAAARRSAK